MRKVRSLTRATLLLVLLSATWGAGAQTQSAQPKNDPPRWRSALGRGAAESLRNHLTYIASDELEGRKTPSRGLDLAAEYIAKQFRAAGLEPAGDDGYFQTAKWTLSARDAASFRLSFAGGPTPAPPVTPEQMGVGLSIAGFSLWEPAGELSLSGAPLLKVDYATPPGALTRELVKGRVVLTEL